MQTIWSALCARRGTGSAPLYRRERWDAPDGDFVDVDWLAGPPGEILLVQFHGLEGSSRSHYSEAFAHFAIDHGLSYAVPHFRGCSEELNRSPRAYHSGDSEEIGWILKAFRQKHCGPIVVVGISLGGNALLCWAEEEGAKAAQVVTAVAAVSAPIDLAAAGRSISEGFNRQVYTRMFLRSMKPKALRKLEQYPGLFDRRALLAARDLYEFDNVFTAPIHGFRDTNEYWTQASAKPRLSSIKIPALLLNAKNDPFVPESSLPLEHEVGDHVTLWQPRQGGHVGFPHGNASGWIRTMPEQVGQWLLQHTK